MLPGDLDVEVMQLTGFRCTGMNEDKLVPFSSDPDREPATIGRANLSDPILQGSLRLAPQLLTA